MSLKDALSFVSRAVSRKDFDERLCHLLIKDRKAVAFDGLIATSCPIDIDMHVKPHARDLMLAIKTIEDLETEMKMTVTPAGKLSIKAGKFKVFVSCLPDKELMTFPEPEGEFVETGKGLMEAIRLAAPFMSTDASRPWAMGMLITKKSVMATNNVVVIEKWHGSNFPREVILPAPAVAEILSIRETPIGMQVSENSATFHYEGDRWLRTQLVEGAWPTERVQERLGQPSNCVPVPEGLFEAIERIKKFADAEKPYVFLGPDKISTAPEGENGAEFEIETGEGTQIFTISFLLLLNGVATKIDLTQWPNPCSFYGDKLRGVIIGVVPHGSA